MADSSFTFEHVELSMLSPFIVGPAERLVEASRRLPKARLVDAFDTANASFCKAFQRANSLAYDGTPHPAAMGVGLGMPAWVFVDCCMLPSLAVGFELPRDLVPSSLAKILDPSGSASTLPISEYIAIPAAEPGVFVGISFFSLLTRRGVGRKTKEMALDIIGAKELVGITQLDNPAMRAHVTFGDLRITQPQVPLHPKASSTFVYKVKLNQDRGSEPRNGVEESFDPRMPDASLHLASLCAKGEVSIVGVGPIKNDRVTRLDVLIAAK